MTYDDTLFDIKEKLNVISDDKSFDIPDSFILSEYITNRAFVLTNTYNKSNRVLDEDITQRLLIPMETVDAGYCGIETNCLINRSKDPLPSRPITTHDKPLLTLKSPMLMAGLEITLVSEGKASNVGNSPFTRNQLYAFYSGDGHIYLMSHSKKVLGVKMLMVKGVFENPMAISNANTCDDADCSRMPIKEAMHKQLSDMTVKELTIKYQIPTDEINDATGQNRQLEPAKK